MILYPFLSAMADSGAVLIDKYTLGRKRMSLHVFIPALFLFLFVITAILVPFLGTVDKEMATRPQYLFMFLLMVVLAITWNVFYYQSIQKEKLYEHELIIMLAPLITILLASVFFPEEYDMRVSVAAAIAGAALFISKLQKHHFEFNKYSVNLLLAVLLMALEIIVIKELLRVYSPVTLYAFRTGLVFLFFLAYYRPKLSAIGDDNLKWVVLSALLGVIYMVLRFYGYRDLGVVHTTLILILGPVFVYFGSSLIFREKIRLKTIFSSFIILSSIIYATYISSLPH